jgi:aminocarboxymuconate-semialdehyde decarboxylase
MTVIGSPVGAGAMVPLPGVDNYAQTEDELHGFHDWLAGLVSGHPEHLRGYVYVNPFGGSAHLANAAARARQREFVGFIANTSVAGRYLHDPAADEFFGMVAQADLPVFLHAPAAPAAGHGLADLSMIEQLGRFCDITIGVAGCVLGGWFEKYPALRVLAGTGAGALALLVEKLDQAWAPAHWDGRPAGRGTLPRLPRPPSSYLDRVWADTATPSAAAIELDLRTFGPGRVLFGTDSPPLPPDSAADLLKRLADLPVDDATRTAVLESNAHRLFGDRLGDPAGRQPATTRSGSDR